MKEKGISMQNELFLGLDLGGTNIKAVLLNHKMEPLDERSESTGDRGGADAGKLWKQSIKKLVDHFREKTAGAVRLAGLAAPGLANEQNTAIAHLPNKLLGLENFTWSDFLNIETYVLNDAHAALVAESRLGAGREFRNIVLLTLGTGVGGGVIVDGKLLQGKKGRAGHFGHLSLNRSIQQSIVNTPGSLENAIGETTLKQRTYGRFNSTLELVEAHRRGETFATWVWLNSVQQLARGIVSLINAFSPEVVILGGGITRAGDALMRPLQELLEVYEWRPGGFQTPVRIAELGGNAGAVGAALFAIEKAKQG